MKIKLLILLTFFICNDIIAQKPNIIFILADDLGYADTEPYGQVMIKTPNFSKMAAEGMKFTQAYTGSPVCAPSKCSLLTGKHQGNAYVRANDPSDRRPFGDGVPLRKQDTIISQVLKSAGYTTGMFGKWGLGVQGTSGSPEKKGWDEFYGYLNQAHAYNYYVDSLWRGRYDRIYTEKVNSSGYSHDMIMNDAYDFVRRNKAKPFFLFISSLLPHAELHIPKRYMSQYLDEKGESIFLETAFPGEGRYHAQENPNAAYASMVSKLDSDVGKLLNLLKTLQIDKNTIVFFASDNGVHNEGGYDPKFFESTGKLRGIKRDLYEGGIRTPFFVWAPGVVEPNTVSNQMIAFWDIMPTIAELAETSNYPKTDGISIVPILKSKLKEQERSHFYWENFVSANKLFTQSLRQGDWKLIRFKEPGKVPYVELYNLKQDISEKINYAQECPDIARELVVLMEKSSQKPECQEFVYWKEFLEK